MSEKEVFNENENENKALLTDKIQSNEDKQTTISDMITGNEIEKEKEEKKVDENKEENNNINKESEKENILDENKNLNQILSDENFLEKKNNTILEEEDYDEGGSKNVHDILWFSALFISMLLGYYIVK